MHRLYRLYGCLSGSEQGEGYEVSTYVVISLNGNKRTYDMICTSTPGAARQPGRNLDCQPEPIAAQRIAISERPALNS